MFLRAKKELVLLLCLALAACSGVACPYQGQLPMQSIKLYFGRDIPGGGTVSEADWADFAAKSLTPAFPNGLTVVRATGQWRDTVTGKTVLEPSFIVEVDGNPSETAIRDVTQTYRTRFHQQAVGVESSAVCAAF